MFHALKAFVLAQNTIHEGEPAEIMFFFFCYHQLSIILPYAGTIIYEAAFATLQH